MSSGQTIEARIVIKHLKLVSHLESREHPISRLFSSDQCRGKLGMRVGWCAVANGKQNSRPRPEAAPVQEINPGPARLGPKRMQVDFLWVDEVNRPRVNRAYFGPCSSSSNYKSRQTPHHKGVPPSPRDIPPLCLN